VPLPAAPQAGKDSCVALLPAPNPQSAGPASASRSVCLSVCLSGTASARQMNDRFPASRPGAQRGAPHKHGFQGGKKNPSRPSTRAPSASFPSLRRTLPRALAPSMSIRLPSPCSAAALSTFAQASLGRWPRPRPHPPVVPSAQAVAGTRHARVGRVLQQVVQQAGVADRLARLLSERRAQHRAVRRRSVNMPQDGHQRRLSRVVALARPARAAPAGPAKIVGEQPGRSCLSSKHAPRRKRDALQPKTFPREPTLSKMGHTEPTTLLNRTHRISTLSRTGRTETPFKGTHGALNPTPYSANHNSQRAWASTDEELGTTEESGGHNWCCTRGNPDQLGLAGQGPTKQPPTCRQDLIAISCTDTRPSPHHSFFTLFFLSYRREPRAPHLA
jgi:hypothetical protein